MRHGQRTAIYDSVLRIEAYRFEGIVQPFPRHFHEQYVIGIMERGQRTLSCKNTVRSIGRGDVVWFHPGDDHACAQRSEEPFDYLGFHIPQNVMLELAEEITGRRVLPGFAAGKGRFSHGGGAANGLFRSKPLYQCFQQRYRSCARGLPGDASGKIEAAAGGIQAGKEACAAWMYSRRNVSWSLTSICRWA